MQGAQHNAREGRVRAGDGGQPVESVKAASELYSPLAGEIIEANGALEDNPGSVNEDPEGNAWFYKIKIDDVSELEALMDENGYKAFIA